MVIMIARALWCSRYGHPEIFERCLTRGCGDTGETESMYRRCHADAAAVFAAISAVTAEMRTTLGWYGDEAAAIARGLNGAKIADKAHAVEASLIVLALDGGQRAKSAIEKMAGVEGVEPSSRGFGDRAAPGAHT